MKIWDLSLTFTLATLGSGIERVYKIEVGKINELINPVWNMANKSSFSDINQDALFFYTCHWHCQNPVNEQH